MENGMLETDVPAADFPKKGNRSETVDLTHDNALQVEIPDALSETDKVKFTVRTQTSLKEFQKPEMSVIREHEEFIWLHDVIQNNDDYAGFIIPPAPPHPDFDASREKLLRLGDGEHTMTPDEFKKMKSELEDEYLATFKKTVAMHEVFLCRLAKHPIVRNDHNFRVFLEYESDLNVRGKNKKEKIGNLFSKFSKSADEVLLSGQKDVDEFFEHEKNYLVEYYNLIKDCSAKADKMTRAQKNVADSFIKVASILDTLATMEKDEELHKWLTRTAETFEKSRKSEGRVSTDTDLKLCDTLKYFMRDTQAAKDLLYRRMRCLANYEAANKNLERARAKNKDVPQAETAQQEACEKFENITTVSKGELNDLKKRRVEAFRRNLIELSELQLKHSKAHVNILKASIATLKDNAL